MTSQMVHPEYAGDVADALTENSLLLSAFIS